MSLKLIKNSKIIIAEFKKQIIHFLEIIPQFGSRYIRQTEAGIPQ